MQSNPTIQAAVKRIELGTIKSGPNAGKARADVWLLQDGDEEALKYTWWDAPDVSDIDIGATYEWTVSVRQKGDYINRDIYDRGAKVGEATPAAIKRVTSVSTPEDATRLSIHRQVALKAAIEVRVALITAGIGDQGLADTLNEAATIDRWLNENTDKPDQSAEVKALF